MYGSTIYRIICMKMQYHTVSLQNTKYRNTLAATLNIYKTIIQS